MTEAVTVPEDFERRPDAERADWQLAALRRVLPYAQEQSEVYRRLWREAGVDPTAVTCLDDLAKFPIAGKEVFLEGPSASPPPAGAGVGFSTRGTSGAPLVVWLDEVEFRTFVRPTVRGFRWAGLGRGDRALTLSPAWHRLAAMEGHAALELGATPCQFWGSVADADAYAESFLDAVRELRPAFVSSTPPFLLSVLRHCESTGENVAETFASVRVVSLVGLALTPGLRCFIRERLGVDDVFERGGTQEGAALDECDRHAGMHVHEDVCRLEVVDDDGSPVVPGEPGRLLVTKLVAGGSPFVRYDTGDRAVFLPGDCPCGIRFSRLRMLGRPESTVRVGGVPVTAYEVRRVLDEHRDLVGRLSLLIADETRPDVLRVAVEGAAVEDDLGPKVADALGIAEVEFNWLGGIQVPWGFRQVVPADDLLAGAASQRGAPADPNDSTGSDDDVR